MQVWDGVGQPDTALAMPGELARRAQQFRRARRERKPLALGEFIRARLAVELDQFGLVVVQVQVRRRAGQVKVDYSLGSGGKMGLLGGQGIVDSRTCSPILGQ